MTTETRCAHGMLVLAGRPTCSICLRQPDVPELDELRVTGAARTLAGSRLFDGPARYRHVGRVGVCARCSGDIAPGQETTWSPVDGGRVADCCLDNLTD